MRRGEREGRGGRGWWRKKKGGEKAEGGEGWGGEGGVRGGGGGRERGGGGGGREGGEGRGRREGEGGDEVAAEAWSGGIHLDGGKVRGVIRALPYVPAHT